MVKVMGDSSPTHPGIPIVSNANSQDKPQMNLVRQVLLSWLPYHVNRKEVFTADSCTIAIEKQLGLKPHVAA